MAVGDAVVGVGVGESEQVQWGDGHDGGGGGGVVGGVVVGGVVVGVGSGGDVVMVAATLGWTDAASAEWEANITVKLVATSVALASPAILTRFLVFNPVTTYLLSCNENRCADGGVTAL